MEMEHEGARAFIGLGSNVEPRLGYLQSAMNGLRTLGEIVNVSSIYETEPVGGVPQPDYLNAVVELRTPLGPLELAVRLKALEAALGRTARPRWHEREIDLDLLFYGDLVMNSPELTLPHPEIPKRAFVLVPMAELHPDFIHPILKKTMKNQTDEIEMSGVQKTDFVLQ